MPKPSIGRVVIVRGFDSNGSSQQPAIVTRVWADNDTADGPVLVNLTVLPDLAPPRMLGSVPLYDNADLARRALVPGAVAHWPDRT